jgi:hypothetical protein
MKKLFFIIALIGITVSTHAQSTNKKKMEADKSELEDKIALKNLVDTFSVLADVKDVKTQVLLFTENASVESFRDGKSISVLAGRKQIGDAFSYFLSQFEVVYHLNGQQTLTLQGDKASGIAYCLVTLIGTENGKKMKTTMGVIYHDEYVRENGKWLISKRASNFTWTEKLPLTN